MKKYLIAAFLLVMPFATFAEESKENIALETCKEMAQEQELTGENATAYIEQCVKTFQDDEKGEAKE